MERRIVTGTLSTLGLSLIFVLLWSSGWIGSRFGLEYTGMFTLLALRYLVLTLILTTLVVILRHWQKISLREFLNHAIIGILCHAVYLLACLGTLNMGVSAGMVAFIVALQPLLTGMLSAHLTGERLNATQWRGLVLGLASILLVTSEKISNGGVPLAYCLPVLSVFALCCGTLLNKRHGLQNRARGKKPTPVLQVLLVHAFSSSLILLPLAVLLEGFNAQWGLELVFAIGWLAVAVSLLAYGLLLVLLRRLTTFRVSCLFYLTPPATMIIGYIVFNETLTMVDVLGLLLATIAVSMVSRPARVARTQSTQVDINLGKQTA